MLDDAAFAFEGLIDCRYTLSGGILQVEALTRGDTDEAALAQRLRGVSDGHGVSVRSAPVHSEDRSLYAGKRCILR